MLIERDNIDAAAPQTFDAALTVSRKLYSESLTCQTALNQPSQSVVVIDVKERGVGRRHAMTGGT
jgi:ribosome-associated toxin RatA of RatAB toxin-antitoxin module